MFKELNYFYNMLYVSEKAKAKILAIKESKKQGNETFVRVSVEGGGCSGLVYKMAFDNQKKDDDQEFEDKGIKIVTDLSSFLYLVDTTLDYSGGLNGKGFHFVNPNASRTCSCGESFSM